MMRRFSFTAGLAARRTVARALREGALLHHVDLSLDEDKGFLTSHFIASVSGEEDAVNGFCKAAADYFLQVKAVFES